MSMNSNIETPPYGLLDTSYQAAGKEAGIFQLCQDFYQFMEQLPEAKIIRDMHDADLTPMVEKLAWFLTMWLGGPATYREKYQFVGMPMAHRHFVIDWPEHDAWLLCMDRAIDKQAYADSFKIYLKRQLRFPAEMIRKTARKGT